MWYARFAKDHPLISRAIVTFCQVALSVVLVGGVLDVSADTVQIAVMSGAGAGLSVIYNAMTRWLESPDH